MTKQSMIAKSKMGFTRHRKSIKSTNRIGPKLVESKIKMISLSLIDLMSFGWLFLGGLLPSRARLRFTSYEDCATLGSAIQNGAAKPKNLRLDFFREATNRFRLGFYVRQYATEKRRRWVSLSSEFIYEGDVYVKYKCGDTMPDAARVRHSGFDISRCA